MKTPFREYGLGITFLLSRGCDFYS